MKKKLIALMLVLVMLFSTSCSIIERYIIESMQNSIRYNGTLTYDYDASVEEDIDKLFSEIDGYLENENKSKANKLIKAFSSLTSSVYYVGDQSNLAYIEFMKNTTNKDMMEEYTALSNKYTDYISRLIRYYKPIYNSVYKDSFYADWEETEIQEAVLMSDVFTDEYVELNNNITSAETAYQELDQSSTDTFVKESTSFYYNIVRYNIQKASLSGYDYYPEYAYKEVYGRDYTVEDVTQMYGYIKDYIVPLAKQLGTQLKNYKNINNVIKAGEKLSGNTITDADELTALMKPYVDALGKDTKKSFETFLKNYSATSSSKAYPAAFTVFMNSYYIPVCYFGPGYQNTMTYIHEFGHFNAFFSSMTSLDSIDLCEVHSQGNEWLYLSYISDNYSKETFEYLAKYTLYDELLTMITATCCDAFEQYIYSHPELTEEEYDAVFIAQAKELGAYEFLSENMSVPPEYYWHYSIVSNSMYYISYAVSMIPAIELFINAEQQGFDTAKDTYNKISTVQRDAGFVETITEGGLSDPFEKDVYEKIYQFFK